jgi:hypothetical protein
MKAVKAVHLQVRAPLSKALGESIIANSVCRFQMCGPIQVELDELLTKFNLVLLEVLSVVCGAAQTRVDTLLVHNEGVQTAHATCYLLQHCPLSCTVAMHVAQAFGADPQRAVFFPKCGNLQTLVDHLPTGQGKERKRPKTSSSRQ